MALTDTSPTVRQRELGMRLRRLRTDLGLTVEDVAQRLLCSPTKISRLEKATRSPILRDVRDLCGIYQVDEPTSAELMDLARKARQRGWWATYNDLNLPYIGLEQDASAITSFTMYYMPALLQTGDYAREVIKGIAPKIDPDVLDQRVEARLRRQKLLDEDKPPRYRVLIDEAVLYRRVGNSAVMRDQLDQVLKVEQAGKVTIQVVPLDIGVIAQDSNFVVLDFDDPGVSSIVFVEGLTTHQYLDHDNDINRYREAGEYLRDSALSPRESLQRIGQARAAYDSDQEFPLNYT